jgi:RimJ/RimL family protein N-acetyltransferase
MRDEAAHRSVEIGDVLFGVGLQRTPAATEAVYLLLRHAFEDMKYRRVEWKCDTRNAASYRAAQRFGFTFEGVFRQHMIIRGQSRDSAWFSMLDHEWPARRIAFERWLSIDNFDDAGMQKTPLAAFHRV